MLKLITIEIKWDVSEMLVFQSCHLTKKSNNETIYTFGINSISSVK